MLGAERSGGLAGNAQFAVDRPSESHGERLHRSIHAPGHQRSDEARVEPAAEHHAQWHVAHQLTGNGIVDEGKQLFLPLLIGPSSERRRIGVLPVLLDTDGRRLDHETVAGRELLDSLEERSRTGNEAEGQVEIDRLQIEFDRDQPARQHCLEL